jgi:hypothetical protein
MNKGIPKVKKVMNTPSTPKSTNGITKSTSGKIMNTKKYTKKKK